MHHMQDIGCMIEQSLALHGFPCTLFLQTPAFKEQQIHLICKHPTYHSLQRQDMLSIEMDK